MAGTFGLFLWERMQNETIEHARTVAVNTLVMFEIFYLFNSRKIEASILNIQGFIGNRYALFAVVILFIFQLGFTYLEPINVLFGTVPISVDHWLLIISIAFSVLPLVEIEKAVIRKIKARKTLHVDNNVEIQSSFRTSIPKVNVLVLIDFKLKKSIL